MKQSVDKDIKTVHFVEAVNYVSKTTVKQHFEFVSIDDKKI